MSGRLEGNAATSCPAKYHVVRIQARWEHDSQAVPGAVYWYWARAPDLLVKLVSNHQVATYCRRRLFGRRARLYPYSGKTAGSMDFCVCARHLQPYQVLLG